MDLLLVIRGLAALAVVVWHAEGYLGQFPAVLNVPGRVAIWIFFGISGYVIAYGFIHKRYEFNALDLGNFYINRFLRIYPLFLAISILSWITEIATTGTNPISLRDLPAQIFAVQFNQDYELIGVFWTLGIEIHFYLLAPFLVMPLMLKRLSAGLMIAICAYFVVIIGYRYAVKNLEWSYDGRNIISNLPHFLTGMIACRIVSGLGPNGWRRLVAGVAACILLGYSSWLYHSHPGSFWSIRGILLVDIMIFLMIIAHGSVTLRKGKISLIYATFATLGALSYGVYAQHAYLIKFIPWFSGSVIALILSSISLAYLSYRIVELPALKLRRRQSPPAAIS